MGVRKDWIMENLNRNKVGYNAWRNKTIKSIKPELMGAKMDSNTTNKRLLMNKNVLEAIKWIEVTKRSKPQTS